jgi:proteic killer suppression protein
MKASRFKNSVAERLFLGVRVKGFPADVMRRAQNKVTLVYYAANRESLKYPPSNHLELLKGKRKGQWSIRINDQWRVCFEWEDNQAINIDVCDYHR